VVILSHLPSTSMARLTAGALMNVASLGWAKIFQTR
jgi:hypothetical protein